MKLVGLVTALLIIEAVLLGRDFLEGLLLQRVLVGVIREDDFNTLYISAGA